MEATIETNKKNKSEKHVATRLLLPAIAMIALSSCGNNGENKKATFPEQQQVIAKIETINSKSLDKILSDLEGQDLREYDFNNAAAIIFRKYQPVLDSLTPESKANLIKLVFKNTTSDNKDSFVTELDKLRDRLNLIRYYLVDSPVTEDTSGEILDALRDAEIYKKRLDLLGKEEIEDQIKQAGIKQLAENYLEINKINYYNDLAEAFAKEYLVEQPQKH